MKKKITKKLIAEAAEFAKTGFSNKQIMSAVDLSSSAFYANQELTDTVKKNRMELRKEIAKSLTESALDRNDTTVQIFLSKRLGLFQSSYKKGSLKTVGDAVSELSKLYKSSDDMPLELINATAKILNDFVKMIEVSELEIRIEKLERENHE